VEVSDRDVTEVLSLLLPGQKQENHKKKSLNQHTRTRFVSGSSKIQVKCVIATSPHSVGITCSSQNGFWAVNCLNDRE
jgi:hypothetical protein